MKIPVGTKVYYNENSTSSDLKYGTVGTVVGHFSTGTPVVLLDKQLPHYLKPHTSQMVQPYSAIFNYAIPNKNLTVLEDTTLVPLTATKLEPGTRVKYKDTPDVLHTVRNEWGTIMGDYTVFSGYVVKMDNPKGRAESVTASNGARGHWWSSTDSFAVINPPSLNTSVDTVTHKGITYERGAKLPASIWNSHFKQGQPFLVEAPGTVSNGKVLLYRSTYSSTAITGLVDGSTRTISVARLRFLSPVGAATVNKPATGFKIGDKVQVIDSLSAHYNNVGIVDNVRVGLAKSERLYTVKFGLVAPIFRNYYEHKLAAAPVDVEKKLELPQVFVNGRKYKNTLSNATFRVENGKLINLTDTKAKPIPVGGIVAPKVYQPVNIVDVDTLQKRIYDQSFKAGFHSLGRTPGDVLALIHSEVSEALEEYRKNTNVKHTYTGENGKPEGFMYELADVMIRIFDFAEENKVNILELVEEKHEFNTTRPHLHGGKKL